VIDAQRRVRMQAVTLGRNFGERVEVLSGLAPGDRLVLNPPDALSESDLVSFNAEQDDKAAAEAAAKASAKKGTP
jgi:multidrug efflux pump subunit AcrA (membrane-fusion protein)